jgi:hypothetical protein
LKNHSITSQNLKNKKSIPTFPGWQSPDGPFKNFDPSNDNDSLTYGDEALTC